MELLNFYHWRKGKRIRQLQKQMSGFSSVQQFRRISDKNNTWRVGGEKGWNTRNFPKWDRLCQAVLGAGVVVAVGAAGPLWGEAGAVPCQPYLASMAPPAAKMWHLWGKKNRVQDAAEETPRSEEEEEEVLHGGQHLHVAARGEPRLEQVCPAGLLPAGRTHTRSRGKESGERSGREELTWADHSPIPHALGPLRSEGSRRLGSEVEPRKRGWVTEKCCFIDYLCFILPNPLIKYLF